MKKTAELIKPNAQKRTTAEEDRKPASLQEVASFVRQVIREDKCGTWLERRVSLRYPIALPVIATVLDDEYRPVGETFRAVTRDLSTKNLCIYHSQPVTAKYLELQLARRIGDERLRVLLEVVRCEDAGPFFEIGGRFLEQA